MKARFLAAILVLALFAALTFGFTYPLGIHVASGFACTVSPPTSYDYLVGTWILAWGVHGIQTSPLHLFDANILYPRTNTLAYADHLLGNLPLTLVLSCFSGNPVLWHNVVLLATFVLCGAGMFGLVHRLTGSKVAAVVAGVVYAFAPYRFSSMERVQVLSTQWAPLALLFLHRFLERKRLGDWLAALAFTVWQGTIYGYYVAYFPLFLALFVATYAAFHRRQLNRRDLVACLGFFLALAACFYPFLRPYFRLRDEMGYARSLGENLDGSADVLSYAVAPDTNLLYGELMNWLRVEDRELFPGVVALGLGVLGVAGAFGKARSGDAATRKVYLLCAAIAFLLALGPCVTVAGHRLCPGPYYALYHWVPGWSGLRRPERFAGLVMLCGSVLAGFGAADLRSRLSPMRFGRAAFAIVIIAMVAEFLCVPQPITTVATGDRVPEVYRWLAAQPDDTVVLDYPVDLAENDQLYMYYSALHWKRIVNGVSGWSPPEDIAKFLVLNSFPAPESIEVLRFLGVRYVIVHSTVIKNVTEWVSDEIERVAEFGPDIVFKVKPGPARRLDEAETLREVPREGWRAEASPSGPEAALAADGRLDTVWTTHTPQRGGMWFALDLGARQTVTRVRLMLGSQAHRFPRYYALDASLDGALWDRLMQSRDWTTVYKSCITSPKNPFLEIRVPPTHCRYLRVLQLERDASILHQAWAIAEVRVYGP